VTLPDFYVYVIALSLWDWLLLVPALLLLAFALYNGDGYWK
jgi:hypothetical protein